MNKFDNLSKKQFLKIFCSFKMNGLSEFAPIFANDIDLVIKLMKISPLLYNSLNIELKKNKIIIENTYKAIFEKKLSGIDFYSVLRNSENNVRIFQEVFGHLPCSENILKILVIDEYCAEGTTELMDKYKDVVIGDDKLLNDILTICGFVGFLKELRDDYDFLLRIVKINGDCLLLASDRLKEDRKLILEAVKNKPMVAFELGLTEDDPAVKTAMEIIRNNAHAYIELPCLDIS